jgi:hypothetical protein
MKQTIEAYHGDFLVETVTDPVQANQAVLSAEYALIICECSFIKPGMKLVSSMMQSAPAVPVIISGRDDAMNMEGSPISNRIHGFLTQPVRAADLAANVISALEEHFYQGIVKGIRVAPFLQIVEHENTSCLLKIINHEEVLEGLIFYREGAIINAVLGTLLPLDAIKEMLFWQKADIFIYSICPLKKDRIGISTASLILNKIGTPKEIHSFPDKESVAAFANDIKKPVGGLAGLYLSLNKKKPENLSS